MATDEPMTEARLAYITQTLADSYPGFSEANLEGRIEMMEAEVEDWVCELLAEVERLNGVVAQTEFNEEVWHRTADRIQGELDDTRAELAAAQATIARLRPVVEAVANPLIEVANGTELEVIYIPLGTLRQARAALEGEAAQ